MKTILRINQAAAALFAGMLVLSSGSPSFAQVQPAKAPVVGVVNTDGLLQDSLAAKGARLERDKYATNYQNQVKDSETKLRAEEQELVQQRGVLAPDVYQQRVQAFQQKVADYQTQLKDKQERLDFAFQQSMQLVAQGIIDATSEVSKERGVNLVMATNSLMIFDPSFDITKLVLDKLNGRLTSVEFQNPDTLQRGADPNAPPGAAGPAPAPAAKAPAAPAKK